MAIGRPICDQVCFSNDLQACFFVFRVFVFFYFEYIFLCVVFAEKCWTTEIDTNFKISTLGVVFLVYVQKIDTHVNHNNRY